MTGRSRWALAFALLVAVVASAFVNRESDDRLPGGTVLVADAAFPVSLVGLADGGLRYGERLSGAVREVDAAGRLRAGPVATVAVSTGGQRGLLGVAVDAAGRTFASWTRPDRVLVVGQVAPGPERLIWRGPPSTTLANGGHLAFAPDGRLVVGIGDLQDPSRTPDPAAPNGKLLALDPDGAADQRPAVLSVGWNNPFGFAYTPGGELWVADNAPGRRPERLGRGDTGGGPPAAVADLAGERAPSALVALDDRRLAVCGYLSRRIEVFALAPGQRPRPTGPPLAEGCATGLARLADGRLAFADEHSIRVLPAPVRPVA